MSEITTRRSVMERVLGGSPLSVFVRLVVMSFVVGIIMTVLDVNPADIFIWVEDQLRFLSGLSFDTLEQALAILFLGAVVVVPVWLLLRVLKLLTR